MNIKDHTTPEKLERYAFLWSEARLAIAAVALLIGGVPPILKWNPFPMMYGTVSSLLGLCWIVSGVAAAYLAYRWNAGGKKLFGGKEEKHDRYAFLFSIVTGFNLGLTGLTGNNIGMSLTQSKAVYAIAGIAYLIVMAYLWKRWKANGEKLF